MKTGVNLLVLGNKDLQKKTNYPIMKDIKEYVNERKQLSPTVYITVADAEDIVRFIKDNNLEKIAEKYDFYYRLREQIA